MTDEKTKDYISRDDIVVPDAIACKVCLKEVPTSVSHTFEGDDYVLNFCGIECYDKWTHQNNGSKVNAQDNAQDKE